MSDTLIDYVIIPGLIFLARIVDVSIGTIRVILLSRGNKYIAPLLGFFEVIIWLAAISKVMQNLTNVVCYIAYGAGFATGNYVGMLLESKLALGFQIVRIISTVHYNCYRMSCVMKATPSQRSKKAVPSDQFIFYFPLSPEEKSIILSKWSLPSSQKPLFQLRMFARRMRDIYKRPLVGIRSG